MEQSSSSASRIAIESPPRVVQSVTSPGGIEAWLVEDHTVPLLVMECAFKGGSVYDIFEKQGCSYFMTSLLDEGAGPYDAHTFQERLAERAIEMGFSTDRDGWYGSFKTITAYMDEAFDLFRLALNAPRFDRDAVGRVRAQIMATLLYEAQNPDTLAGRAFFSGLFPHHPYGYTIRGTLEGIEGLTSDDLVATHTMAYARDRLVVVAVGSITSQELAQRLDALFGDLPQTTPFPSLPPANVSSLGIRHHVSVDVPQSVIYFGRPGFLRHDPDFIPGVVVNHIFGGGSFTSRLFKEIREKRGLAYGVSSSLRCHPQIGLLTGGTATQTKQVDETIAVIEEQMKDLIAHGPTAEELEDAKTFLIGSYPLRFDTSSKTSGYLLHLAMDELGIDYIGKRNGLVQGVSHEDALRAAKRLFGQGELFTVVAGR